MAISDKILYLNNTKKLLKQEINKSTEITDEDTFRSYAPKIYDGYLDLLNNGTDTLWNNLEKVSASEETPVLENVETAPIKMVLNGNTSQKIIPKDVGKEVIDTNIAITDVDIEKESYIELQGNTSQKIIPKDVGKEVIDTDIAITDADIEKESCIELNGNASQETTTGKNLFTTDYLTSNDFTTYTKLSDNSFSFTATGTGKRATYKVSCKPNTDYYFNISSASSMYIQIKGVQTKTQLLGKYSAYLISFNSGENTELEINIGIGNNSITSETISDIQLEEGTIATSFEKYTGGIPSPNPDYPQEVKVVKGENVVSVQGKNLLNPSVARYYCNVNNDTGIITITKNATDVYIQGAYVYSEAKKFLTLPSGNYYLKSTNPNVRITFYGDIASLDTSSQQPQKLNSETNFGGIRIRSNSSLQNVSFGILLSTSDDTYVPYSKTDYPINLGTLELCKIGDYQDYLYKNNGKWYVHKEIGKTILNGSENWVRAQHGTTGNYYYRYANSGLGQQTQDGKLVYSNYFSPKNTWNERVQGIWFDINLLITTNGSLNNTETLEDFISWLSTHNTIVYYVLATPTETEITDTTLIEQLDALHTAELQETSYISSTPTKEYPYINLKYNVVTPAPSPDRASEINKVTGNNVISVQGKNLFDVSKLENASWNYPNAPTRLVMFLDKANQGTKMSATNLDTTTYRFSIGFAKLGYASQTNTIVNESGWTTNSTYTITANNDGYPFLQISRLDNANVSASEVEDKFQFEYGDTASEYAPFSKTDYPINLVSKNLFDKDNQTKIQVNAEGTLRYGIIVNAPNKKVSISGKNWSGYIAYKPLTNGAYGQWVNTSQDTTINVADKLIIYSNGDTIKLDTYVDDLQIEISDAPTDYESYFTPIELCKINTYKDYFHKDSGKWYVHKEIGKVVFDGSENWSSGYTQLTDYFTGELKDIITDIDDSKTSLSNYFVRLAKANELKEGINYLTYNNSKYFDIRLLKTRVTTLEDFKTWLSTHNTIVYYILATPTEEEITNTTLIEQLETLYTAKLVNSTTYISTIADNLEPFIDLNYNVVIPSPSPEKPSEIKVVKGENVVSVQGKNLANFPKDVEVKDYPHTLLLDLGEDKTIDAITVSLIVDDLIFSNPKTNGAILDFRKADNTTHQYIIPGQIHNSDDDGLKGQGIANTGTYSIVRKNITFRYLWFMNHNGATQGTMSIQAEYGSTATPYVPYSKIDYPIDLIAKNIFDKDNANILNAWIDGNTKQCKSANDSRTIYIPCTPNTKYGISKIHTLPTEKERFRIGTATDEPATLPFVLNQVVQDDNAEEIIITTGANDNYLVVFFYNTSSTITFEEVLASLKIVRGGGYFDIEFCKIDTYKDYFHKDSGKWYKHKEINKVVLDGTENWQVGNVGINKVRKFYLYGATSYVPKNIKQYSNYAEWSSAVYNYGYGNMFQIEPSKNLIIVASDNMTLAQFKEKLNTTPMVVYYILATPTEEEITNSILIEQLEAISKAKSVKDKTYITQSNDELPFILDVEAIKEYEENLDSN